MYGSKWIRVGCLFAAAGVATGAFGAHGLKTHLETSEAFDITETTKILDNWDVGVHYLLIHSIAIVLTGLVSVNLCSKFLTAAGSCFTAGAVSFSGGLLLYNIILVTKGTKLIAIVAFVVPLGGICFILGWIFLAIALCKGECSATKTDVT